jgi:adenylate kinase family enzyme
MNDIRQKMLEALGLAKETILDDEKALLKCLFLTGGPGSGKSYVVKQLSGLVVPVPKIIDSDKLFSKKLDVAQLPQKIPSATDEDPEKKQLRANQMALRDKAMSGINKVLHSQLNGYFSVIIDGTGKNAKKMKERKEIIERLGYDSFCLIVNTSLPVAQERNAKRERSLPPTGEGSVEQIWGQVQANIPFYQELFGSNCLVVNNDPEKLDVALLRKTMTDFFGRKVTNPVGQALLANKDKGSITRQVSPDDVGKFESVQPA